MKLMIKLALLGALVVAGIFVFGSYHIVRTKDGFQMVEKKSFSFEKLIVDTREWSPVDWIKNKDISAAMAKKKVEEFSDKVSDSWKRFSKRVDDSFDDFGDFDMDKAGKDLEKDLQRLRKEAKKRFDKASKKFENGSITKQDFEKKMDETQAWLEKRLKELKKKFE